MTGEIEKKKVLAAARAAARSARARLTVANGQYGESCAQVDRVFIEETVAAVLKRLKL